MQNNNHLIFDEIPLLKWHLPPNKEPEQFDYSIGNETQKNRVETVYPEVLKGSDDPSESMNNKIVHQPVEEEVNETAERMCKSLNLETSPFMTIGDTESSSHSYNLRKQNKLGNFLKQKKRFLNYSLPNVPKKRGRKRKAELELFPERKSFTKKRKLNSFVNKIKPLKEFSTEEMRDFFKIESTLYNINQKITFWLNGISLPLARDEAVSLLKSVQDSFETLSIKKQKAPILKTREKNGHLQQLDKLILQCRLLNEKLVNIISECDIKHQKLTQEIVEDSIPDCSFAKIFSPTPIVSRNKTKPLKVNKKKTNDLVKKSKKITFSDQVEVFNYESTAATDSDNQISLSEKIRDLNLAMENSTLSVEKQEFGNHLQNTVVKNLETTSNVGFAMQIGDEVLFQRTVARNGQNENRNSNMRWAEKNGPKEIQPKDTVEVANCQGNSFQQQDKAGSDKGKDFVDQHQTTTANSIHSSNNNDNNLATVQVSSQQNQSSAIENQQTVTTSNFIHSSNNNDNTLATVQVSSQQNQSSAIENQPMAANESRLLYKVPTIVKGKCFKKTQTFHKNNTPLTLNSTHQTTQQSNKKAIFIFGNNTVSDKKKIYNKIVKTIPNSETITVYNQPLKISVIHKNQLKLDQNIKRHVNLIKLYPKILPQSIRNLPKVEKVEFPKFSENKTDGCSRNTTGDNAETIPVLHNNDSLFTDSLDDNCWIQNGISQLTISKKTLNNNGQENYENPLIIGKKNDQKLNLTISDTQNNNTESNSKNNINSLESSQVRQVDVDKSSEMIVNIDEDVVMDASGRLKEIKFIRLKSKDEHVEVEELKDLITVDDFIWRS